MLNCLIRIQTFCVLKRSDSKQIIRIFVCQLRSVALEVVEDRVAVEIVTLSCHNVTFE